MQKIKNLKKLIAQCTEYLRNAGYADSTVRDNQNMWNKGILVYAQSQGVIDYTAEFGEQYLSITVSKYKKPAECIRNIRMLTQFNETGTVIWRSSSICKCTQNNLKMESVHDYSKSLGSHKSMNLRQLVEKCIEYLRHEKFSEDSITRNQHMWERGILAYATQHNITEYTAEFGKQYLSIAIQRYKRPNRCIRNINILTQFMQVGMLTKRVTGFYEHPCEVDSIENQNNSHNSVKGKNLKDLIEECTEYLRNACYSADTIERNYRMWTCGLLAYAELRGIMVYTEDIGEQYLDLILPKYRNRHRYIRNIRILNQYMQTGEVPYLIKVSREYPMLGEIGECVQKFLDSLKSRGMKDATLYMYKLTLSDFTVNMHLLSISKIEEITELDIWNFINKSDTVNEHHLISIRVFCQYMFENGYTKIDLSYNLRRTGHFRIEKLPSIYTAKEIAQIENSINQASAVGKRDYAMVLLATRLGLRVSDICKLTFRDIDWEKNKISLMQYKTGSPIELPLLRDVGEAIVNYIKYARPVSSLANIFLTAHSPYREISRYSGNVQKIVQQSGVVTSNRKRGPHAMRHSLASRMLENGMSLPIISEVLGHSQTKTTMAYLKIDEISLLCCELDVPVVDVSFYEQGGGMFYE